MKNGSLITVWATHWFEEKGEEKLEFLPLGDAVWDNGIKDIVFENKKCEEIAKKNNVINKLGKNLKNCIAGITDGDNEYWIEEA